jgi:methionyl-tRNA formyltransferase
MRIIFMGSPEFAVLALEALNKSAHDIVCVVTQPDRPKGRKLALQPSAVKVAAHRLGIPVLQPETTKNEIFLQEIQSFRPDLLAVVAYGEILRRALLDLAPVGAVNLHASLLPKYRGAAPIPWAILKGESITGATTILLNEVMDGGPILLQEECAILPTDTSETLSTRIASLGAPLLKRTIDLLEKNQIEPKHQDLQQVTYAPKLRKEDGLIDWQKTSDWIARQLRAFHPWPASYSYLREMRIKFWLAHPVPAQTDERPGTVIHVAKDSFDIACGDGTVIEVLEVQPENRSRFAAADFIHGYSIQPKDRFSSGSVS